jgi:phosphate uptake regulator
MITVLRYRPRPPTLFAAHVLERIADHVGNIAETVIYVVTGETVGSN